MCKVMLFWRAPWTRGKARNTKNKALDCLPERLSDQTLVHQCRHGKPGALGVQTLCKRAQHGDRRHAKPLGSRADDRAESVTVVQSPVRRQPFHTAAMRKALELNAFRYGLERLERVNENPFLHRVPRDAVAHAFSEQKREVESSGCSF